MLRAWFQIMHLDQEEPLTHSSGSPGVVFLHFNPDLLNPSMSNPISSLSDCTPELLAAMQVLLPHHTGVVPEQWRGLSLDMQVNGLSLALRASFRAHDPTFIPLLLDALFLDIGILAYICRLALKEPLDDSDTAAVREMLPLLPSWCLPAHDIVATWVEKSPTEHIQALLDATQTPEYALGILWESCMRKRLDCATAALQRCNPLASGHEALRRCLALLA